MKNEMNENELADVVGGLAPVVIGVKIAVKIKISKTTAAAAGGGFAAGYIANNE